VPLDEWSRLAAFAGCDRLELAWVRGHEADGPIWAFTSPRVTSLAWAASTSCPRCSSTSAAPRLRAPACDGASCGASSPAAPNGEHALALHKPVAARLASDPVGAFSLVPLRTELPSRIIATPGKVSAVATSPSGDRFVVLERSDERSAFAMHVAEVPSFTSKRYELASPPTSVGIVSSSNRAFASQVHPQGRISFVDLPTGLVHTLTGFELGAR